APRSGAGRARRRGRRRAPSWVRSRSAAGGGAGSRRWWRGWWARRRASGQLPQRRSEPAGDLHELDRIDLLTLERGEQRRRVRVGGVVVEVERRDAEAAEPLEQGGQAQRHVGPGVRRGGVDRLEGAFAKGRRRGVAALTAVEIGQCRDPAISHHGDRLPSYGLLV